MPSSDTVPETLLVPVSILDKPLSQLCKLRNHHKDCISLVVGGTAALAHRSEGLLTQDQQKDSSSEQEEIEEECFSTQAIINLDDVDSLIEYRFTVSTPLLKHKSLVKSLLLRNFQDSYHISVGHVDRQAERPSSEGLSRDK